MRHYNIPVFIPHMGCPFRCIFCNQNKIASQAQIPEVSDVEHIVEQHLATIPRSETDIEIAFFGGSFTAISKDLQQQYLAAVNPYLKSGRVQGIRLSTRPDYIDKEILDFLFSWGVTVIELGVQSMHEEVLKASRRGYETDDVLKACKLIKEYGFKLGIQLMIGLPGDNYYRDMETTEQVLSINPDMIRIYPTLVVASTYLATLYHNGEYIPLELDEAIEISKDMLIQFQKKDIDVIRIGLQPSEDLRSEGTVIAGPFHPSFGELVEQAIFKDQAELAITSFLAGDKAYNDIVLYSNKRDISKLIGCRKSNIAYLGKKFGLTKIQVKTLEKQERDWVGISELPGNYPRQVISRTDYINFATIK
ncbi:MAG: radical SAM protein [Syntrophomonadaceae bacterium]|nr:radical SAM protein [Syntrophomonadaceae bacterium]